jgi:hypothetical protein
MVERFRGAHLEITSDWVNPVKKLARMPTQQSRKVNRRQYLSACLIYISHAIYFEISQLVLSSKIWLSLLIGAITWLAAPAWA